MEAQIFDPVNAFEKKAMANRADAHHEPGEPSHHMVEAPENITAELKHEWTKTPGGTDCLIHVWSPLHLPPRAVAVLFHGLGGHGLFPTVRYLAELLVAHNLVVYSMDLPGHGQSYGLRGYLSSSHELLQEGRHLVEHAQTKSPGLPVFFAGTSMGGAVALLLSLQVETVSGLILLAPMIALAVSPFQRWVVQRLAMLTPKLGLMKISMSKTADRQFRDKGRKEEVLRDPFLYQGRLRAASAMTCIELTQMLKETLGDIRAPLLCLLAEEDYVVDNTGIDNLMQESPSVDKTLKEYDALHGLLCELHPVRCQIENDIISWLSDRIR
jgi:acylglycerol lipase